jgi:putative endonuclease
MQDAKTLVFAEVRFRRNADFAGAAQSITGRKKARIVSAPRLYLARLAGLPPCRFDAPLLTANAPTQGIKDAFSE